MHFSSSNISASKLRCLQIHSARASFSHCRIALPKVRDCRKRMRLEQTVRLCDVSAEPARTPRATIVCVLILSVSLQNRSSKSARFQLENEPRADCVLGCSQSAADVCVSSLVPAKRCGPPLMHTNTQSTRASLDQPTGSKAV